MIKQDFTHRVIVITSVLDSNILSVHFFGIPDLNAITPDSSPAYTLQTEHPTGKQYTKYLNKIAKHYELPIKNGYEVLAAPYVAC